MALEPVTAIQSSTYDANATQFGAGNCIDGNTDSDYNADNKPGICQTGTSNDYGGYGVAEATLLISISISISS